MIDIPELQLIAVCFLGFALGGLFLDYFIQRPILFALVAGMCFYGIRYIIAFFNFGPTVDGQPVGNGIASAMVMWTIYIAMMVMGKLVVEKRWGKLDEM